MRDNSPSQHLRRQDERWKPPQYDVKDVRAIQALVQYAAENGPAPGPHEVKRALDWIINSACGTYEEPFVPGRQDVKDYLMGRRSVGLAIVKLMHIKPEVIEDV